jgi:hypothetical protein
MRHAEEVISRVQKLLAENSGCMWHEDLIKILTDHYSEVYARHDAQQYIIRELAHRNIAVLIHIRLPDSIPKWTKPHAARNPDCQVLVASSIPKDQRESVVRSLLRQFQVPMMPAFRGSTRRTISKDALSDLMPKLQRKPNVIKFPSIPFRAMLLHPFLIQTFGSSPFTVTDITTAIPIHLALQILRGIDQTQKWVNLSMIHPLRQRDEDEIKEMILYLRCSLPGLVNENNTMNLTAKIEVPRFGISRLFDFVRDKAAYSDYWTLYFSLVSEETKAFPVEISRRFETILSKILDDASFDHLPFFPRHVERLSQRLRVCPAILSDSLHRKFMQRLGTMRFDPSSVIQARLFPSGGLAALFVTKKSTIPVDRPHRPEKFDFTLEIHDCSLRTLAKLAATSRLTRNGYILDQNKSFMLFRKHIHKWIFWRRRTCNIICSLKENPVFRSLFYHETAKLIQFMRTPLLEEQPTVPLLEEQPTDPPKPSPEPSPAFDLEGTMEVRESEFLAKFDLSRRICDCTFSVSVAVEFLKVVLSNTKQKLFPVCLRQISHLPPSDMSKAVFFLCSCGIYRENDNIKFPENKWTFDCPAADPHPMSLPLYDDGKLKLNWAFTADCQPRGSPWDVFTPKFDHSFQSQITTLPLPKLPPIQEQQTVLNLHESDVLLQFTFGRYESEFPQFKDFLHRFVFNLIHSAGVDGISFRDLINSFGINLNDYAGASLVLQIVYDLLSWELVARVPSATIDQHFSRFLPINQLYREVDGKVEMVDVHAWINPDGSVHYERLADFKKNIVVYVFAHEFCDFEELMTKFCYLSPFDLCLIVDSLEDDEIVVSLFYEKRSGGLLDEEISQPIPRFEFPELFLALVDRQRQEALSEVMVHRIVRMRAGMFKNISHIHTGWCTGCKESSRPPSDFKIHFMRGSHFVFIQ